jgi:hypothetical protein
MQRGAAKACPVTPFFRASGMFQTAFLLFV